MLMCEMLLLARGSYPLGTCCMDGTVHSCCCPGSQGCLQCAGSWEEMPLEQLFTHEQQLLGNRAYEQGSTVAPSWQSMSPGVYPCGIQVQGLCSSLCLWHPARAI